MNTILLFLTVPRAPLWKYCLTAFPLALLPSAAIAGSVYLLLAVGGVDISGFGPPQRSAGIREFLSSVVFAPLVETAILALVLRGLLALSSQRVFIASISALLWGALHATAGVLWFFGTTWSFFVFSCAYLTWRQRSFREAFAAAAIPHALVNLSAMVMLALEEVA